MHDDIIQNKITWDIAAKNFYGGGALPSWGALMEGTDMPELIGEIKGKTFLEIACGSGHSIKYLIENGAEKVYGIDLSEEQIKFATELNKDAVEGGKVELFCQPMEQKAPVVSDSVDTVFSIYGIGWTQDLEVTLSNVYSYLKPTGMLIFSFETQLFARTKLDEKTGQIILAGSPYEDLKKARGGWFGSTSITTTIYRLPSTWIRACLKAGLQIVDYFEPKPIGPGTGDQNLVDYYSPEKVRQVAPTFIFEFKK